MPTPIDELVASVDSLSSGVAYELEAAGLGTRAKPFARYSKTGSWKQFASLPPAEQAETILAIIDKIGSVRGAPGLRSRSKYAAQAARQLLRALAAEAKKADKAANKASTGGRSKTTRPAARPAAPRAARRRLRRAAK